MPRIPQNLHKHAIDTLSAGMMMNAVAVNIGYSTGAQLFPDCHSYCC